jgi:hypothetical protein
MQDTVEGAPIYLQEKFDGHRVLVEKEGESVYLYSKEGDVQLRNDDLLARLRKTLAGFPDCFLDAELLAYNQAGEISPELVTSVLAGKQYSASFNFFDMFEFANPTVAYKYRYEKLLGLTPTLRDNGSAGAVAPTMETFYEDESTMRVARKCDAVARRCIFEGWEGVVLRAADAEFTTRPFRSQHRSLLRDGMMKLRPDHCGDIVHLMAHGISRSQCLIVCTKDNVFVGKSRTDNAEVNEFVGARPRQATAPPFANLPADALSWFQEPFPIAIKCDYRLAHGQLRFARTTSLGNWDAVPARSSLEECMRANAVTAFCKNP